MITKKVLAFGVMLFAAAAGAGEVVCESSAAALKISNGQIMLEAASTGSLKLSGLDAQNGSPSMIVSLTGSESTATINIKRWVVEKNTPAEAIVRFYSEKPDVLIASCTLRKDADFLNLTADKTVAGARADFTSESAVKPNVTNGEDYIYWPEEHKRVSCVPNDCVYLMNLMNSGSAIAAFMWNSRDTEVCLEKKNDQGSNFDRNQFKFGKTKQLWIGFVTGSGLWLKIAEPLQLDDAANTNMKGEIKLSKKVAAFRAKLLAAMPNEGDVVCELSPLTLKISNGQVMLEAVQSGPLKFSSRDDQNGSPSMTLTLIGSGSNVAVKIKRWDVEKNTPTEAIVSFYTEKPEVLIASCTLRKDSDYLSLNAGRNIEGVRAEFPSESAVLPDMVGDEDYIYWPDELKRVSRVPGDGFCLLNLMNGGSAMAAFVWNTRETEICLEKKSDQSTRLDCNQFKFGITRQLWIGLVTAPGLWHKVSEPLRLKEFTKINWTPPFTSDWRMTMKYAKGPMPLMDNNFITWRVPYRSGNYYPSLGIGYMDGSDSWTIWSSYVGYFLYPCYFQNGEFYATATALREAVFSTAKPPLIYTYKNLAKESAKVLPFTILKQYLPDHKFSRLELLHNDEEMGRATCGVTPDVLRYFKDDKVKQNKDTIINMIDFMDKFVEGKEKRVQDFRKWAVTEISWLKQSAADSPELKLLAEKLSAQLAVIEQIYTGEKEEIKTPAESYRLSQEIINLSDSTLPAEKQEEICDQLGREIREIAGRRDDLTAELYAAVKALRGKMTAMLTENLTPVEAALVLKLRADCGERILLKEGHDGI